MELGATRTSGAHGLTHRRTLPHCWHLVNETEITSNLHVANHEDKFLGAAFFVNHDAFEPSIRVKQIIVHPAGISERVKAHRAMKAIIATADMRRPPSAKHCSRSCPLALRSAIFPEGVQLVAGDFNAGSIRKKRRHPAERSPLET